MKYLAKNIYGLFFIIVMSCCGHNNKYYDEKLITTDTILNFYSTDKRGIKRNNIVYYVSADKQTLLAIEEDKIIWQSNIINICGAPYVGEPVIHEIAFFRNDTLSVTFGQHDFADVDAKTGKTTYLGAD